MKNQLSELSLNENQNAVNSKDFNRLVIQFQSVIEYAKDESCDAFSMIRLFD